MTAAGRAAARGEVRGADLETASPEVLDALHARLGDAFARPGTGWSVWLDQWRTAAPGYFPESGFGGCLAARAVDAAVRRQFTDAARPVFANSAFLALHYVPQPRDAVLAFLLERDGPLVDGDPRPLPRDLRGRVAGVPRSPCVDVTWLRGDELSSYLAASVTFEPGPLPFADGGLAPQLACADWGTRRRRS